MKREMMTTDQIIEMVKGYAKGKVYLEIGIFRGKLLSEVGKVAKKAIGIDNFSQFDDGTNEAIARERCEGVAKIITGDCYSPEVYNQIKGKVDVLFYDAGHSYSETKSAMEIYAAKVKKGGLIIMDDWNVEHIRAATMDSVPCEVIFEKFTPKNASEDWWNGIAVLKV